jgi:hypothetical protein
VVEGNPDWAVTLERIASSVVSIDVDAVRALTPSGTPPRRRRVRGMPSAVLTNRHVVTPTEPRRPPSSIARRWLYPGTATRCTTSACTARPEKLRFISQGPAAVPGRRAGGRDPSSAATPRAALSSPDAGARIATPEYGVTKYNDFNTFYLQAVRHLAVPPAPVIDIRAREK